MDRGYVFHVRWHDTGLTEVVQAKSEPAARAKIRRRYPQAVGYDLVDIRQEYPLPTWGAEWPRRHGLRRKVF